MTAIATTARGLVDRMREVIWAVNPACDNVESLARFLSHHTETFTANAGLSCRLAISDPLPALMVPAAARHHLYLVVKEALNNVVKHASATSVQLALEVEQGVLSVSVSDDGTGFVVSVPSANTNSSSIGNGLANMRQRISDLGGVFDLTSSQGRGTRITLHIPMKSFQQQKL